uniref:RNA-directed DNA polymerase n=1 Tax=Globodera pallida TaxID=36090 RepID=A0A183BPS4_GLOPA
MKGRWRPANSEHAETEQVPQFNYDPEADETFSLCDRVLAVRTARLSDAHKDLRQECLRQMERARKATPPRAVTLEALLEECRAIQSLQNSAAALAPAVHTIQVRPQRVKESPKKGASVAGTHTKFGDATTRQRVAYSNREWIWINLHVNGRPIKLAADSCSHLTIIQRPLWISLGEPKLDKFRNVDLSLECWVADTDAPSIMGLEWIRPFEQATQQPVATTLAMQSAPTVLAIQSTEDPQDLASQIKRAFPQYQRLPFGVKSAPSIFQKVMDQMTAGLPGVFAYLDDIIIASANLAEHMSILFKLFSKIQDYGFRIQLEKCHFLRTDLKFLGHVVSAQGIRPDPDRSVAIREMPPPHDVSTLRSFLGAINYYGRFIKQMSELRAPLDSLLKKDSPWAWGKEQQSAFDKAKQILLSDLLLTHYDPTKPIVVAADASQHGIGATLSHKAPDGSERVVEHACRTLTASERNYAQIEREALALIFACQKFHRMIYGRKFVLLTDHKPLLAIFGSKKGIPIYTAARLQRWALTLANYDFTIQYVKSENFGQADVLSRLVASHRLDEDHIVAHAHVDAEPYNVDDVTEYVYMATLESLPVSSEEVAEHTGTDELLQQVETEWSFHNNCDDACLDHDIEHMVKQCSECPCMDGRTYLILVDALSKWPEITEMTSTTARSTITALSRIFHRYGTPVELVSDNGPPFSSTAFLRHTSRIATDKRSGWSTHSRDKPRKTTTPSQLLQGLSPAELFLGRKLRTPLSRLQPSREKNAEAHRDQYQEQMRKQYDRRNGTVDRHFKVGNPVLTLNYGRMGRPAWLEGKIVDGKGLVWKKMPRGSTTRKSHPRRAYSHKMEVRARLGLSERFSRRWRQFRFRALRALNDAHRALFKELSPAQTTTLDLVMTALRAKLDSPQRREIAKRTLTLCRQREDESAAQFLRRLTLLVEATNHSLTEAQRKEKAQAEELEALLMVNKGNEVSRLSQAVNVINVPEATGKVSDHFPRQTCKGSRLHLEELVAALETGYRDGRSSSAKAVGRATAMPLCGRIGHLAYAWQER